MVLDTRDNGEDHKEKVLEYRHGQMVLNMKEIGETIKPMGKGHFGM